MNDYNVDVIKYPGAGGPFVEKVLHHPAFRYGVTPDVVGRIKGEGSGVIEIKATSVHSDATGLQTAAQLLAVRVEIPSIGSMRRGVRLLKEDPFYDAKPYTEKSDEAIFLSLLNGYNWLKKRKLLKENRR